MSEKKITSLLVVSEKDKIIAKLQLRNEELEAKSKHMESSIEVLTKEIQSTRAELDKSLLTVTKLDKENGQLLAYVMRKDGTKRFECFIGATNSQNQIFLMESGSNCQRNLRSEMSGMMLTNQSKIFLTASQLI